MGKVVGGGSSINVMVWARGHKVDFDNWAEITGDSAWNYESVLEIYRRIEDWQGADDPQYRGKGGLLWVEPAQNPSPLAPAMLRAAASSGIRAYDDHNGVMNEREGGVALCNLLIKQGRRRSISEAYLHPVLNRPNLTVLTGAEVLKVNLHGTRASVITVFWRGELHDVKAARETILSAGAFNTPKLLMLSGIGDPAKLSPHGIDVKHKLSGVGENLQDHPIVAGAVWELKEGIPPRNNFCEALFFCQSDPSLDRPDLLAFQAEVPYASEITGQQFQQPDYGWSLAPGLMRPKSVGHLRLTSSDPRSRLQIEPNFLQHPDDMKALIRGIEISREIGNSVAMRDFVRREVMPGNLSGQALVEFIRNGVITFRHQTGTCKMGRDEASVVDSQLRVHGIEGLRIADGSIMPEITSSNTMAPCVIIGERMGEILSTT